MKDTMGCIVYVVMKRRILFVLPVIALLVGCSGGNLPSRQISLNEDVVVRIGETVLVRGEGTTIYFELVLEDSRCPINADCVQAGQIRVSVKVTNSNGNFTQESKYPISPAELVPPPASGYHAAIIGVTPDRFVPNVIPVEDYRLTIRVTKTS